MPKISDIIPAYARSEKIESWAHEMDDDLVRGWNECPSFIWMTFILRGLGVHSSEWRDLFDPSVIDGSAELKSSVSKMTSHFMSGEAKGDAVKPEFTPDEASAGLRAAQNVMKTFRERFDIVELAAAYDRRARDYH